MKINENNTVTLHYTLRLEDGSIADSSKNYDAPATVKLNDGTLQPAFVEKLIGLTEGAKERFLVPAEAAFGEHEPRAVHTMPRDRFSTIQNIEPGVILEFTQPSGEPINGVVREVSDDNVTVDLNHPLAGKDIIFEVEILAIN